jgi:type I restriction enzyme S subunit
MSKPAFSLLPVSELCTLKNGYGFEPKDWTDDGLPIIRIQNLNGGSDFNFFSGTPPSGYVVNPGDLLFAWSGNRGTSFGPFIWRGPRGLLNQHIFKVTPKPNVQQAWLYHALHIARDRAERQAHGGSGLVHVKRGELLSFEIPTPPPHLREEVAAVLDAVDRAIEQTEALISKYQRIKMGLMQGLFTRGIDEHGCLRNPATHKFKPSPLGPIPAEWEVQTLSALADPQTPICYGIVQVKRFVDGGVPTLAIRDLEGDYRTNIHHTAPAIEAQYTRSRVEPGDLLISIKGTTGRIDVVPETFRGNISRDLARIRFKDVAFPHFFKFYFQSQFGTKALDLVTVGTTRKEISIGPLKQVNAPAPPKDEQKLIAEVLRAVISLEAAEEARLRKLGRLKTGLMQDLLTGKVSVEPLLKTQNTG